MILTDLLRGKNMEYIIVWITGDSTKVVFKDEKERDDFIKTNSFLRRKDGVVKMVLVK